MSQAARQFEEAMKKDSALEKGATPRKLDQGLR